MMNLTMKGIDWKEKFRIVSNFYEDDLPNPPAIDAELRLWQTYWKTHWDLLNNFKMC